MCSVFELLNMDNFQGDLTDVVRGIGSGHVSSPGPPEGPTPSSMSRPPTSDLHVEFPTAAASASCLTNPFGDPFVSMTDPLLHLAANSGFLSGAGDNESNNSFAVLPKGFEDDQITSQCSVFPRIRISQSNIIQDASTCNSPAIAVSNAPTSPWGMISVDATNSPRNCLLVDNSNNMSSASQIQISSSPQNIGIKRRKSQTKKVVCIPAPAAMNSRSSGEVVPSDLWAWRKYGQKPIKGSPYPRGYYRCSSSKGCSARKQVERSRTDPNMLVITYTSEHNHPWPTQRNALAGSTRSSSSSSSNLSSKFSTATATTSPSSRFSQNNNNKDEHNKSHLPSSSTPPYAAAGVKEEKGEERHDNMEFDNDVEDTYRPELLPEFQHQPEDFFADLDELEGDSLNMLLSHSSGGGNMDNTSTIPDVFSDFFDDDDSSRSL
ncbi:PREDICTED: probable WRKY transcription factor 35 [Camelina sativa]|uniref:Probable WRKY transcription factor 35 n=1 Tax=Camelina sativa TaxID=90675 RepID=A0ABM0YRT4_CAMSA|nr:PREDICTED: probable WRKY transcription factor 35 [Camelina sativa]